MPKAEVTETSVTITWSADEVDIDVVRLLAGCEKFNVVTTAVEVSYNKGVCNVLSQSDKNQDNDGHPVYCKLVVNHVGWHWHVNPKDASNVVSWPEKYDNQCDNVFVSNTGWQRTLRCVLNNGHNIKHQAFLMEWDGNGNYEKNYTW